MRKFIKATVEDATILAQISEKAFTQYVENDEDRPVGFDSPEWQISRMEEDIYYKILEDEKIVGGIIVKRKAAEVSVLYRLFIDPEHQNRGIGEEIIQLIENTFLDVNKWVLQTREKNYAIQHFYEKMGYVRVGETIYPDNEVVFDYEKFVE